MVAAEYIVSGSINYVLLKNHGAFLFHGFRREFHEFRARNFLNYLKCLIDQLP